MGNIKKSASLFVLFILILNIFIFSIDGKANEIYSNSDDVLFYEDFENYPDKMNIYNKYSAFYALDGIGILWLMKAFSFTYFNINYGNFPQYKFNNMTVKAKIINNDNVENKLKGSIGWGFCRNRLANFDYEFVWFIYQQGSPLYPYNGFWVWSRNSNGDFSAKRIEGIDIFEWHVYNINWTKNCYDFYIDGELVAQIDDVVSQDEMGIEIWNDNTVWYPSKRNISNIPILRWFRLLSFKIPLFNLDSIPSRITWGIKPVFHRVRSYKRLDLDLIKITQ